MIKRIYYQKIALILTFIPFVALSSSYQDTVRIDQVVVTATRTPRQLKETPILTRVITSSDITKYGRAKFEDILTTELAGIEFHQAGYGTTLSFQGLDARHILVLIDGERQAGEVNGNIDFSRINPLSIERIEVMKGSSSVLYGSSAMGATINIITKDAILGRFSGAALFKYTHPYQKNSKSEGKNSNIPNLDGAAMLARKWNRVSSVTDFKLQSSDPYRLVSSEMEKRRYVFVDNEQSTVAVPSNGIVYVPIDSSGISVSGWRMLSVNEKLNIDLSSKLKANLKAGYYAKERFDLNKYNTNQSSATSNDNYNGYRGLNIDADLVYEINRSHRLSLSLHENISWQKEYSSASTTPKQRHELLSPRLLYGYTHKKGVLTVGLDYDVEKLNYDQTSNGYTTLRDFKSISFYAQEELRLTKNFELTLGIRGLYKNFDSNFEQIDMKDDSALPIMLTPKFGVTYIVGQTTLRANWSMGYRNPTLKERYIKYFQPYMGSWIVGNEALTAERNNYLSLSGEYFDKSGKFTFSLMGYANYFRDKIDTYLDTEQNSYIYANTEKTRILGIELNFRAMIMKDWWLGGNYAYNHNKENAPTNSSQYIFTSPHTANINSTYRYKVGNIMYQFSVVAKYIGDKNYEDRMPTIIKYKDTPIPGLIFGKYKAKSEGYIITDLSVSATYATRYKLILGVDNIFNYRSKVASFNSATTPGIGGSLTLSINF